MKIQEGRFDDTDLNKTREEMIDYLKTSNGGKFAPFF